MQGAWMCRDMDAQSSGVDGLEYSRCGVCEGAGLGVESLGAGPGHWRKLMVSPIQMGPFKRSNKA